MKALNNKRNREKENEGKEYKNKKQKNEEQKELQKIKTSFEEYQKRKITEFSQISEFSPFIHLDSPSSDLTMFQMKELANIYLKENKYIIEDILQYDDTNKDIQKDYLVFAVNELNKTNKSESINIIKEKIQKSGIILDKNIYEEEIKNIKDEKLSINLEYIDYKSSIIETLEYIKSDKIKDIQNEGDKYIEDAKNLLKIRKIFTFNHESTLGNNNYYFYGIAKQISFKLEEILSEYYYGYYKYIIDKILKYLVKNILELTENEIYIFKYLIFILTDKNAIRNESVFNEIKNFLEGNQIKNIDNLKKVITSRNEQEKTKEHYAKNHLSFNIELDKNDYIEYTIKESNKIDRIDYSAEYMKKYRSDIFNEEILNSIKNMNSLEDLEVELFKNILPNFKYSSYFFEDNKKIIFDILSKILKSRAAKKFFFDNYESKYGKDKIKYHFDKDEVINEIKSRIEFYPVFDKETKANTNPIDLTIIVNSIPGKFILQDEINYFNKNILQITRIVIFLIHEIFGHFIRRYYSYITKGLIKMDTNDDDCINTKPEGGFFAEREFLGFKTQSRLYLKDALFLLFYESNMDNYPIIKPETQITEEILKIIIKNNPELFSFIDDFENEEITKEKVNKDEKKKEFKKNEKEETSKKKSDIIGEKKNIKKTIAKDKITISQYCNYLNPVRPRFPAIISCGFRKGEMFIEM